MTDIAPSHGIRLGQNVLVTVARCRAQAVAQGAALQLADVRARCAAADDAADRANFIAASHMVQNAGAAMERDTALQSAAQLEASVLRARSESQVGRAPRG